jgi:hypothetical protein
MREWRHSSTILDLYTRWRRVVSYTPLSLYSYLQGKSPWIPIGWASESVWTLWRREKSITAGKLTPTVAIPIELYTVPCIF